MSINSSVYSCFLNSETFPNKQRNVSTFSGMYLFLSYMRKHDINFPTNFTEISLYILVQNCHNSLHDVFQQIVRLHLFCLSIQIHKIIKPKHTFKRQLRRYHL